VDSQGPSRTCRSGITVRGTKRTFSVEGDISGHDSPKNRARSHIKGDTTDPRDKGGYTWCTLFSHGGGRTYTRRHSVESKTKEMGDCKGKMRKKQTSDCRMQGLGVKWTVEKSADGKGCEDGGKELGKKLHERDAG